MEQPGYEPTSMWDPGASKERTSFTRLLYQGLSELLKVPYGMCFSFLHSHILFEMTMYLAIQFIDLFNSRVHYLTLGLLLMFYHGMKNKQIDL